MTSKEDLRQLFESHYDRMYLLARVLLHDDEDSRDAVSDVFARIADGTVDVRPDTAGSYLLTCVRNRCLKLIRARQVRERARRLLTLDDTVEMIPLEAQTDILDCLLAYSERELTPQTARVFELRYRRRLTYAEIAAELSISEAAVYKHLARALRSIRDRFGQRPAAGEPCRPGRGMERQGKIN